MSNIIVSIVPTLQIQSMQFRNERYINIPFKLTTNGEKFYLDINTETKLCELKDLINEHVLSNFRLRAYDIVQVGTDRGENGPVINTESNMKLERYLQSGHNFAAFYIRPLNSGSTSQTDTNIEPTNFLLSHFLRSTNTHTNRFTQTFDCAICLGTRGIGSRRRLRCAHEFCINCINQWMSSNNENSQRNRCPICRRYIE